jgi:hypothetical protein
VEAEAYSSAVVEEILRQLKGLPQKDNPKEVSSRIFYPRISIYDQEMVDWAKSNAVVLSNRSAFPRRDFNFLSKSLSTLPVKNLLPTASANFGKRVFVLAVEYVIAIVITILGLNPLLIEAIFTL